MQFELVSNRSCQQLDGVGGGTRKDAVRGRLSEDSHAWPLPPPRPKRAAYGFLDLRSGSGQGDAHALRADRWRANQAEAFRLTYKTYVAS